MVVKFYKFQGTGNDFVIFDNRHQIFHMEMNDIFRKICDRHFGIGADGVMLFQEADGFDFEMLYFNANGKESTMCGNGGRCMVRFAEMLGFAQKKFHFLAIDGVHDAVIDKHIIRLKMGDVQNVTRFPNHYELNTGSPHYVEFVDKLDAMSVKSDGARVRYSEKFKTEGINVNFVETVQSGLKIRTYERGVEDETYSCGTGVTAAALMASNENQLPIGLHLVHVETIGGMLLVEYHKISETEFSDIWLSGPAEFVFSGEIELPV